MVFLVSLSLIILGSAARSHADTITIAGFTFDETAFADWLYGCPDTTQADVVHGQLEPNQPSGVLGYDVTDYVAIYADDPYEDWFTVVFTDNAVVNDVGPDLVVFDYDWSDVGEARVNKIKVGFRSGGTWTEDWVEIPMVNSNQQAGGHDIYYAEVDLTALGILDGEYINNISIGLWNRDMSGVEPVGASELPSVGAIGATNNVVPIPPTVVLLGLGLVSLVAFRRESKA